MGKKQNVLREIFERYLSEVKRSEHARKFLGI